jgi:hypothetical protein
MKARQFIASLMWLALATAVPGISVQEATAEPRVISTDVCSVLKRPGTFVGRVIRLRGLVYLGVDHMNIGDRACPGRGLELAIMSDRVFNQRDVSQFYAHMNHQGRKGVATVTGLLRSDPHPLTPLVLNIQHVAAWK